MLASIGRNIYGKVLYQRALMGGLILFASIIVISIMVCGVLIGGFYTAYQLLLESGHSPAYSLLVVECAALIMTISMIAALAIFLRRLRDMPRRMFMDSPLAAQATTIVESFVEGFSKGRPL